jgi:hypothetical protein
MAMLYMKLCPDLDPTLAMTLHREETLTSPTHYDFLLQEIQDSSVAPLIQILRIAMPGFQFDIGRHDTLCDYDHPTHSLYSLRHSDQSSIELAIVAQDLTVIRQATKIIPKGLKIGYDRFLDTSRYLHIFSLMISFITTCLKGLDIGRCRMSMYELKRILELGGKQFEGINMVGTWVGYGHCGYEAEEDATDETDSEVDQEDAGCEDTPGAGIIWPTIHVKELLIGVGLLNKLMCSGWAFKDISRLELLLNGGFSGSDHTGAMHEWKLASTVEGTVAFDLVTSLPELYRFRLCCNTLEVHGICFQRRWVSVVDDMVRLLTRVIAGKSQRIVIILSEMTGPLHSIDALRSFEPSVWGPLLARDKFPQLKRLTFYLTAKPAITYLQSDLDFFVTLENCLFLLSLNVDMLIEVKYLPKNYR